MTTLVSHFAPLGALAALGLALVLTPVPPPLTIDELAEVAIAEMRTGGDDARIADRFRQVLERDPAHVRANYGVGMAAYRTKRYKDAEGYLRRALDGDPTNNEIRLALATTYQKQAKLDEAIAMYKELRRLSPDDGRVLNNLAELEISRREFKAARDYLKAYSAMLPKRSRARRAVEARIAKLTGAIGDGGPASPAPSASPASRRKP